MVQVGAKLQNNSLSVWTINVEIVGFWLSFKMGNGSAGMEIKSQKTPE